MSDPSLTLSSIIIDIFYRKGQTLLHPGMFTSRSFMLDLITAMRSWDQFSKHKSNVYFFDEVIKRVEYTEGPFYRMGRAQLAQIIIMINGRWEDGIIDDITNSPPIVPVPSSQITWYWLWETLQWVPVRILGDLVTLGSTNWSLISFLAAHPDAQWAAMDYPPPPPRPLHGTRPSDHDLTAAL